MTGLVNVTYLPWLVPVGDQSAGETDQLSRVENSLLPPCRTTTAQEALNRFHDEHSPMGTCTTRQLVSRRRQASAETGLGSVRVAASQQARSVALPQLVKVGRRRVAWRTSDIMKWQHGLQVGTSRAAGITSTPQDKKPRPGGSGRGRG